MKYTNDSHVLCVCVLYVCVYLLYICVYVCDAGTQGPVHT